VLEAVFILLEFPSPSRKIFIGSHSLPPSLVRRIGHSIVLIIIELKNVFLDDKLKQASEYISVEGTLEGLHNTKNFESSRNEFDDS
jgi:hypothetical protein